MNILIAPDKFKGTLSAEAFCEAAIKGFNQIDKHLKIIALPMSDGGEGFLDMCIKAGDFIVCKAYAFDPLMRLLAVEYLQSKDGKTAIIETAKVSGLQLLDESEYNCLINNTLGLGELIRQIIEKGIEEIKIGIGGTATTDAGTGMAYALGYRFFDRKNQSLIPVGANLVKIDKIVAPNEWVSSNVTISAYCDVSSPLYGQNGAAYMFSRQKGADVEGVKVLDAGLMKVAHLIERDLGMKVADIPGSGAGGGLGAGIVGFLGGKLKSGAEFAFQVTNFEEILNNVDLVITGEGRLDEQSTFGKLSYEVCQKAKLYGKKAVAIVGSNQLQNKPCFDAVWTLEEAAAGLFDPKNDAAILVEKVVSKIYKSLNQ